MKLFKYFQEVSPYLIALLSAVAITLGMKESAIFLILVAIFAKIDSK